MLRLSLSSSASSRWLIASCSGSPAFLLFMRKRVSCHPSLAIFLQTHASVYRFTLGGQRHSLVLLRLSFLHILLGHLLPRKVDEIRIASFSSIKVMCKSSTLFACESSNVVNILSTSKGVPSLICIPHARYQRIWKLRESVCFLGRYL
jgi:hypothetical protein